MDYIGNDFYFNSEYLLREPTDNGLFSQRYRIRLSESSIITDER
jgi:hypothetical protein